MSNILVIAAHPDDEVLGCGGALLRHKDRGDIIDICIATESYPPKWDEEYRIKKIREQKKVDEQLDTRRRFNLDFPTVKLDQLALSSIIDEIRRIIEISNPFIIYTHYSGDLNQDHEIINRAVLVATRGKIINVYGFKSEWSKEAFIPTLYIDISNQIERKCFLLRLYRSEIRPAPHPRNNEMINIKARYHGIEAGVKHAEGFTIIKQYGGVIK